MVRDTPPSQDVSTHQIWNSYLKEYRRYGPDTKAGQTDGRTDRLTDGRTVRLLYASQSSFGGIIKNVIRHLCHHYNMYIVVCVLQSLSICLFQQVGDGSLLKRQQCFSIVWGVIVKCMNFVRIKFL